MISEKKKELISQPEHVELTPQNSHNIWKKWFGWIKRENITEFEVFFFGMTLVVGSQNSGFGTVYDGGYWNAFFNFIWAGSAYVALSLCLAEITSTLPFSGGIYGFVRASTGPYYGFMVACLEILFNITYVAQIVQIATIIPVKSGLFPSTCARWMVPLFYGFNYILCLLGGKPFWTVAFLLGATSFALMMIYLFGSLAAVGSPEVNFNHFCASTAQFSLVKVLQQRTAAGNQFRGIHYLPLNSDYLKDPKKQLPRIILLTILIVFLNANFIGITVCSQAPGIEKIPTIAYPLKSGWMRIFNIGTNMARWLNLPGLMIAVLGFIFSAGKQLNSIAESGYLPKVFTHTIPVIDTPYSCLTISTFCSFLLSMWMVVVPSIQDDLATIPSLAMQFIFLNAFICYIIFKYKFSNLHRSFESPVGIWGAIYGICNNSIGVISNIFFVGHNYTGITTFLVFSIICTFVYIFYISKHQKFSEEEKKILFKAYLINANVANRQRMKKNKIGPDDSKNKNSSNHTDQKFGSNLIGQQKSNQNHTGPLSASAGTSNSLFPPLFNKSTVSPMPLSIHEEAVAADIENNNHSNKSILSVNPRPTLSLTNPNQEEEEEEEPTCIVEERNLVNTEVDRNVEIHRPSGSHSIDLDSPTLPEQPTTPGKISSSKLLDRISSKFSELKQSFQMDPEELKEYSQLMILKSGGEIDSHEMENIQEKYQLVFHLNP